MLVREITPQARAAFESAGMWQNKAFFQYVDEAAQRNPDKLALADQFHRLSYAEVVALSKALAAFLIQAGVKPGDAVSVQAPNSVLLPLVHIAVSRVQGVYVPMHEAWRETEVHHLLATSQAKIVFGVRECHGFEHYKMIEGLSGLEDLEQIVPLVHGAEGLDLVPGRDIPPDEVDQLLEAVPLDSDAARHTMISSGTTAMPKISEMSDNGYIALLLGAYVRRCGMSSDDIVVGLAPAATGATGYVFPVVAPLMLGATSILLDPWLADNALNLLEQEGATCAVAVPTQLVQMLDSPLAKTVDLTPLRFITNGGAPLAEVKAREIEAAFGCQVHTMYGTTDAGVPLMMPLDLADPGSRVSSVGTVAEGMELILTDAVGQQVAPGQVGEILWRGAQSYLGYRNDEANTTKVFDENGWYHSGDLGSIDSTGFIRIVGRTKDMIIRGGQNIFPGEIEEILSHSDQVAAVAVVGVPDDVMGERACACVTLKDPNRSFTFENMIQLLDAAKVAKFKRPEFLEILESFPESAGGKIQKAELAKLVQKRDQERK